MRKIACDPQVGTDMEVFLQDADYHIVPCVGLFEGTKEKPWTPKGIEKGFAMQEDNVMCEFNVKPAKTHREGLANMQYARKMVFDEAKKHKLTPRWGTVSHKFKASQLDTRQAKLFGCEADFDAYTGGARRRTPAGMKDSAMRSCGGHIHLGGDFKCPDFVAGLFAELFLGVGGNGLWTAAGKIEPRKEWYGAPGIFRPKEYGVEYRTPDNTWCAEDYNVESIYMTGISCATYLTETSPEKIQQAFRSIPWTEQREYMQKGGAKLRVHILEVARRNGVPV